MIVRRNTIRERILRRAIRYLEARHRRVSDRAWQRHIHKYGYDLEV